MTHIALFHSVYGLRPAVIAAVEQFRAAGHVVVAPDLYAGQTAATLDEGFALQDRIGWPTIMECARNAVRELPDHTILAGLSMGAAGVAGDLLAERRGTAGLLLLHGIGGDPAAVRDGLPVQVHIAAADEFFSAADVAAWREAMAEAGAVVEVLVYPGAGHLFTDPDTPDHDGSAATLAWRRSLAFLHRL